MTEQTNTRSTQKFSIFSYGFRPFFLAAGVYAILPLLPWIFYLTGMFDPNIPLQAWHGHEMLFGFVTAAITGFLLTAIPNWTNTPPLTGKGLKQFFYFWLSGRIAFWLFLVFDHPVFGYLLFLDLLLPIAQAIRIAKIFIKTGSKRNFIFIGIMVTLAIANLLVILQLNNITTDTAQISVRLAPNIIMIVIAIIGGRITPNFTRSFLKQRGINVNVRSFPIIEALAIGLLVLNAIVDLAAPQTTLSYGVALSAFAVHAIRLSGWESLKTLKYPLIWVLHLGYLWLVITLFLKGSEAWLELPYQLYLHAFTVGAVGIYMLGVMSRATLGHTGRPLIAPPMMVTSYLLINAAAIMRVYTPFQPDFFLTGMVLTTILWIAGFALYLWIYAPILTSPRVDGMPG